MKIVSSILLATLLGTTLTAQSNRAEKARESTQLYIEDSTRVFWTRYPNPISPSTFREDTKVSYCGEYNFYCDLAETVQVLLVDTANSIVASYPIISRRPDHNFSLCYWIAGKKITPDQVPKNAFRAVETTAFYLILSMHGRRKTINSRPITVNKGHYCWIALY